MKTTEGAMTLLTGLTTLEGVWAADRVLPDYGGLRLLEQTGHHLIHEGDARYRFLLGVSIVEHKGVFYSAWGASAKDENAELSILDLKELQQATLGNP